jgi:hypothetical protein
MRSEVRFGSKCEVNACFGHVRFGRIRAYARPRIGLTRGSAPDLLVPHPIGLRRPRSPLWPMFEQRRLPFRLMESGGGGRSEQHAHVKRKSVNALSEM